MTSVYLALILFGLVIFHAWIRYRRMGRIIDKMPGMRPLPFLGNMLSLMGDKDQLWNIMRSLAKEYAITRIWFFTRAWVAVRDPDDIEILLTNKANLNKRAVYELALKWLETGLLTSGGEKWVHRRKIVNTGFHFNIMKKYVKISGEHAEKFIEKIKSHGDEYVLDLVPLFSDLTLQIICESAFGVDLNKLDQKLVQQYKGALHVMYDMVIYRSTRPYIRDWMMNFLPIGWKQNRAINILHNFTNKVIQERREYYNKHASENRSYQSFVDDVDIESDYVADGRKKRLVMLDVLLSAEREGLIDAKGVREEVDIFTVAGHDTTAVTMAFMMMLLAENPEIQDRARAEVINHFEENGGKLNITEIQKFEYLDRCIKETLRLYPPISQFVRYMDKDIQLKKYLIPAGVDVLFLTYDTQRDPRHWTEPDKFDPDRFLPENAKKRHPFAYIPFSAGLRSCIGQKFAMLELKAMLAHILYNFYVKPVDLTANMKLETYIVLQPSHPVHVKSIRRNVN
ncbi:cytochrome P450 4AB17 [Nasonia vitripennis]|uniref:Cytochrome P450 n=1 Tax=Nasonia vitripennis TaxID=7425 RepID=A0A7M6UVP0_NASVI|nr:cytochrome P450 4AB17 [Nasonia vitripennis]